MGSRKNAAIMVRWVQPRGGGNGGATAHPNATGIIAMRVTPGMGKARTIDAASGGTTMQQSPQPTPIIA
ncbi:MAG: hypothetical protein C0500_09835 [Sphingobium sp.]|nr:hypothetical protein [Sphingobium sp.]